MIYPGGGGGEWYPEWMVLLQVEVDGMLNAHIKDAVALCDWAARMEYEIQVQQ